MTNSQRSLRTQAFWMMAGIAVAAAFLAWKPPAQAPELPLYVGIAGWWLDVLLVALLSAHPLGTRAGVLVAGWFLALPAFVAASPLTRGVLASFLALPLVCAVELLSTAPSIGFGARLLQPLAYLNRGEAQVRRRSFQFAAFCRLAVATAAFAASIFLVKIAFDYEGWLILRWFGAGMMMLALAEMMTAGLPLMSAVVGLRVAPFFHSPYRATTVSEFWAQRWNLPASELLRQYCFTPLARRHATVALWLTFAVSALGHAFLADLALGSWAAISWALFFLVQPLLISFERKIAVRRWPASARRSCTLLALALTSPLFLEPLLQMVEKNWGPPELILQPTMFALGFVLLLCAAIALASLPTAFRDRRFNPA